MTDAIELLERPEADETYMIVGFRQWADAGAVSSGLPEYLVQHTQAHPIGSIRPDGFYLFQIPGTHDLVRPVVQFNEGFPESLNTPHNDIFFSQLGRRGLVIFLGDEPQIDVERYVASLLEVARQLNVKRIIGLGGVYGELPYDKERPVSANYSLRRLKREIQNLAVDLSDYKGGASIGSYICKRAGEQRVEYVGLYSFVPAYDFSSLGQAGSAIRLENDFMAWLGIMRRVNYMLQTGLDLSDLESRSQYLIQVVNERVEEIEQAAPELGVRNYLRHLADVFDETIFSPDAGFWEEKLRGLLDKLDDEEKD
jgi:hypothetical protein